MKKARIEVIDIAKAVTIFLVILGHTTGDAFYKRVIYSFHMPLFFVLSGISAGIKPVKAHNFIRKNICAVLVPFVIWGLIYAPFSFRNLIRIFYASWESLGSGHSLTSLWFLSCLFTAKIITQALTGSIAALAVSLIICAVIGRYVPEMLGKSARNEIQIMP